MKNKKFILNNTHREYMGLKPLEKNYELKIITNKYYDEYYIYFDGTTIKKIIFYYISPIEILLCEYDVCYETEENRTILLPKTTRGKKRKLNYTAIKSLNGQGNYVFMQIDLKNKKGEFNIGNYTTQKTFFNEEIKNCDSMNSLEKYCNEFIKNSTKEDLEEVTKFSLEKRQHINYKEGDYFRIKLGKKEYTYGRILMDIYKREKQGKYWNVLMGRPLMIEIFYILTDREDVTCEELEKLSTFPAQHILDNSLYYGDFVIIGHGNIPENTRYPIMYGQDKNKIVFQCGEIHKEIEWKKENLIRKDDKADYLLYNFKKNAIGFHLDVTKEILKKCLKDKTEDYYWESIYHDGDLRSKDNQEYLIKVLKQMKQEHIIDIYKQKPNSFFHEKKT